MNVEYVWKPARRWSCPTVAIPCVLIVTTTGKFLSPCVTGNIPKRCVFSSPLCIRYVRSQSCPFCRGNLKRVSSGDLWILTSKCDVVDTVTLAKENLRRFCLYIEKLPHVVSENTLLLYDYLI